MLIECRENCGACCIAPSIKGFIPGMPEGKPAGVRCIQLASDNRCQLFGKPERPKLCQQFAAELSVCGSSREEALHLLETLEIETQ